MQPQEAGPHGRGNRPTFVVVDHIRGHDGGIDQRVEDLRRGGETSLNVFRHQRTSALEVDV